MGSHDAYGKKVLKLAAGKAFLDSGPKTWVDFSGTRAMLDGVIGEEIAVEIESRTSKQVRGAVLDLICHPYSKKLLVLISAHTSGTTAEQCRNILGRFISSQHFQVVVLEGSGFVDSIDCDVELLKQAIKKLQV